MWRLVIIASHGLCLGVPAPDHRHNTDWASTKRKGTSRTTEISLNHKDFGWMWFSLLRFRSKFSLRKIRCSKFRAAEIFLPRKSRKLLNDDPLICHVDAQPKASGALKGAGCRVLWRLLVLQIRFGCVTTVTGVSRLRMWRCGERVIPRDTGALKLSGMA